jgi:hypothetical protein
VMHSKDLREATAKAAEKATQSPKTRLSPGQKRQRKRMATVASGDLQEINYRLDWSDKNVPFGQQGISV